MRAVDIIAKKRDGGELSREELSTIVNGYVSGEIPEYQISAFLMAVYFKGMTFRETADLTDIMLCSGDRMDLSGIKGPFVDKHSTGGVGDKISIILAPIAAACGVKVPMMSGRALGHTGGTLDKLDSVPGYKTRLSEEEFRTFIKSEGYAMTGQTDKIVPADKKLYSLRDVTATVESVPLITASILSKKVAEGSDALVFDVKCGPGAFMKTQEDAERLANSLAKTGQAMGKKVVSVITDMTEPLGNYVGNFFEIEESILCLQDKGPKDLMDVTYNLTAWMLVSVGIVSNLQEGLELCKNVVKNGQAMKLFKANIINQGGDFDKMMSMCGNYRSKYHRELKASKTGYISSINAYKIGMAGITLGVGRNKTTDPVSPDVGFIFANKKGSYVKEGDKIADVYGKDEASIDSAWNLISEAISISDKAPQETPLIIKEISAL